MRVRILRDLLSQRQGRFLYGALAEGRTQACFEALDKTGLFLLEFQAYGLVCCLSGSPLVKVRAMSCVLCTRCLYLVFPESSGTAQLRDPITTWVLIDTDFE